MSLRPLRTFRIVAQKAHQRAADWIRLLLLQPMTDAIKQSVFLVQALWGMVQIIVGFP
ncbi:MAG: hypothetical protein WAK48_09995 [Candidatus Acidiferrum sp.]|jgi:hypothetical protein